MKFTNVVVVASKVRNGYEVTMFHGISSQSSIGFLSPKSGVWTLVPSELGAPSAEALRASRLSSKLSRREAMRVIRKALYKSLRRQPKAERATTMTRQPKAEVQKARQPKAEVQKARKPKAEVQKARKPKASKKVAKVAKSDLKTAYLTVRDFAASLGFQPVEAYRFAVQAQNRVKLGEAVQTVIEAETASLQAAVKPKASKTLTVTSVKPSARRKLTAAEITARHNAAVAAKMDALRALRFSA